MRPLACPSFGGAETDARPELHAAGPRWALDLFGEIVGGGTNAHLLPDSDRLTVFGFECRCLSLRKLIEVKRAAGRPKDFDVIAALEALDDERSR